MTNTEPTAGRPADFDGFLHARDGRIVTGRGEPVLLRGVGLGNWLLPEGYMWRFESPGAQSPREIEALVADLVGPEHAAEFGRAFTERFLTRDDAIKAALHYPQGLNTAKTFAAVNAPFAPDAYRYENGQVMAGPDCKFAPGCQNISTQSLAIFQRLGDVQTRVIAVDERMGIVWLRMAWGVRERGGDQLTVWETFKVYDSQIHAVEAFMRILPVEKRNGGWE